MIAYRENGKQRYETFRTLDEARRAKAARETDIERGEFEGRSRITLHEYARAWVERYQGRGRRGFREGTRDEYKRLLEAYALKFFPAGVRLTEITPSGIAGFVGWLCDPAKQEGRTLGDQTVRNIVTPLRVCLATAVREGLIRSGSPPATLTCRRRGSLQHEIIEGTKAMVFGDGDVFPIHIECMDDAERLRAGKTVRYALVVSVETAVETSITIHEEIRARLRQQIRDRTRGRVHG